MITIVGVGHVFAISENIRNIIKARRPDLVCLELDPGRYNALMNRQDVRTLPLHYALLARFQKRMAERFGSEVGDEMVAAAQAAGEVGAKLALIDMDASRVFSELWRKMSFREKIHLFGSALIGLVASKETVEREVSDYEEHSEQYIDRVGIEFPSIKEVLIDRRNKYMAERIAAYAPKFASIVVIVGDGHVPGMTEQLRPFDVEVVRLKEIRNGTVNLPSGSQYTTSFWYKEP